VRLIVERLDGDRLVAHEPKRATKRGVYLGKRGAIAGLEPATSGVTSECGGSERLGEERKRPPSLGISAGLRPRAAPLLAVAFRAMGADWALRPGPLEGS
jgi:hypothetical protein